ncbi:hypothetical protein [Geminocystis sp. NIES-3709]|uniref:hypothetical protein n=1 Tax=Geminocystis sp. NIES-3709 TaxID=1617448 RepID=UPI0005FCBF88|nr:hypothetical protein [Geminocystis sp. NIES-3709]BAQ64206.1 hypothetical protein GM3709_971 [Geminocystis sp. NIES-3709]
MLFGYLVVYKLSIKYLSKNFQDAEKEFIRDYTNLVYQDITSLKSLFDYGKFYILKKNLGDDLFNKLKYIRKVFRQNKIYIDYEINEEPLFMSLLWIQEQLKIEVGSKIIFIDTISTNDYIMAFDKSKEEAIKNCQDLLKHLIQKRIDSRINIDFEKIMQNVKIKCDIVSPWGE